MRPHFVSAALTRPLTDAGARSAFTRVVISKRVRPMFEGRPF